MEKHPDKTFIGRIERGFDFLGYHFGPEGLTMAAKTIEQFVERAIRLYEQEPGELGGSSRLGMHVRRWVSWARIGFSDVPSGTTKSHRNLVVETTNFDPKGWISSNASAGRMHAVPQSDGLRVVERFTRTDENTINWQTTIEDPDVYTAPWTVEVPFRRQPDYIIYEYACHEGNHAIEGVMGGQRAVEVREAAR